MPTVILSSNADGAFFLNGSFLSTVKQKGTLSVPLGTSPSFISFFPVIKDRLPVFALLEYEHSLLKCSHCRGELLRWSDSIYEFFVFSDEKPPSLPPIVTCESQWGNGFAASQAVTLSVRTKTVPVAKRVFSPKNSEFFPKISFCLKTDPLLR